MATAMSTYFENEIRSRDVVRIAEFTTHSGLSANCKLELDNRFLIANPDLAEEIARNLAEQMGLFDPRVIVPIPRGANKLGELVAKELRIGYVALCKTGTADYKFRSESDRAQVVRAERVGLVDDVFTSGSSFRELSTMDEFTNSVVVGGVIWDRSKQDTPKDVGFEVVSVVSRYVPLRIGASP